MSNDANKLDGLRLDDQAIREYLQENSDFFTHNDDLLSTLQFRHSEKGAVSLLERQQQKLRQRVSELEQEITDLMVNAQRNESIFNAYSQLYVNLLRCSSLSEVVDQLRNTFERELGMPALSLKLFNSSVELDEQFTFTSDTHKQLLSRRFEDDVVYLGRLTEQEHTLLFNDHSVASVALLLLGDKSDIGLLAVGSRNAGHFEPAMDKLLITQLQALLSALLPKILVGHDAA